MNRRILVSGLLVVPVLSAAVMFAACSGGSSHDSAKRTTTTRPVPALRAPVGDLYQPPAGMRRADPGTLIWARLFAQRVGDPALFPDATIWQMLYHSRDRTGHDIAVSGFAVVPKQHAPTGGRPVYAWAHDLVGLGDRCAPSKAIPANLPPYARPQIDRGAVLVATDYEGLGTPGDHPYLVGVSAGQAVLDSVRAAASLPQIGTTGPVVIAGTGEGGHAALWAAQIARSYAPDLDIRGVLAIGPTAELPTTTSLIDQSSRRLGVAVIAAAGLHAGYHDFDPSDYLTPAAAKDLARVNTECAATTIARYRTRAPGSVIARGPNTLRSLHNLLVTNSPGAADPHAPILILQGGRDGETPAATTDRLRGKYCALHAKVVRTVYPVANGESVVKAAQTEALRWITDRYRNRPPTSDCR